MMTSLNKEIQVVPDEASAAEMQSAATKHGVLVWRIVLTNVSTKPALLKAIGKALRLPRYYGLNWDSLEECLRDSDEGQGWLIIFNDADNLLALSHKDLSTLAAILSGVGKYWAAEGRTFGAIFVGSTALSGAFSFIREP